MLIAKAGTEYASDIFKRASVNSEPVIFSTDTIYGIGAPISDKAANLKIFDIKGRDISKPFPILISSEKQLEMVAEVTSDRQIKFIDAVWPGPVTLILKAKEGLDNLYTVNGTVAVRLPDKKWLTDIIDTTGPLSATSANPSGHEYVNDTKHILNIFDNKANFFIFEQNDSVSSSAIINISSEPFCVIRSSEHMPDISSFTD